MSYLFHNLFVSSPNGGGLFLLHKDEAIRLDRLNTTGLCAIGGMLARGVQMSTLLVYGDQTREINSSGAFFNDIHDVLIDDDFLYAVGTAGNEIVQFDDKGSEVRRWVFHGEKDSYHVNCLASWNERIVFSAFGDFQAQQGYKDHATGAGFVQDLNSGERLIEGLSQPHSLFVSGENLILANSEKMEIHEYSPEGELLRSKVLDGYLRGICSLGDKIYVGCSRWRYADDSLVKPAAVIALDGGSWEQAGRMELPTAETYAIQPAPADNEELLKLILKIVNHSANALI